MDVHEQTREVIQRDVLQDPVHHRFDHEPVDNRAVHAGVNAKVLNLHDALVLRVVHLGLDVREPRHVVVQDADGGQTGGNLALRVRGVVVHLRGEVSALAPLVGTQLQVELDHLIGAERDPLADEDGDVRDGDDLVEVVADGGLLRGALRSSVRVAAHDGPADSSKRFGQVRGHHVGDVLGVRHRGLPAERHRAEQEPLILPHHLQELPVDDAQVVHQLPLLVGESLGYQRQPAGRDLVRRDALVLLGGQTQALDQLALDEVVQVVFTLLRHVQIHPSRLDNLRRRRVVVLEHLLHDALVNQHQHRELADPPLLLVHRLRAVRVLGDEVQQLHVVHRPEVVALLLVRSAATSPLSSNADTTSSIALSCSDASFTAPITDFGFTANAGTSPASDRSERGPTLQPRRRPPPPPPPPPPNPP